MSRPTSKAAFLEIKESGAEVTQAGKILGIVQNGGSMSLREILAAYRENYGDIESSSVSARVNKLKEDSQLEEGQQRKCSITDKIINPVRIAGVCSHNHYRSDEFQQLNKVSKDIVWTGRIVQECRDCKDDISKYKLVPVMTKNQYLRSALNE